tara:strand:+ start:583 stop:1212 length:630 start_codon:yes stop_codon:yes gene_type:complete
MTKSIYDQLNACGTVAKQRFVENFTGYSLNTDRWATVNSGSGTPSYDMSDSIDGGLSIKTSTTTSTQGNITFNDIRPFSPTGSVFIAVIKQTSISNTRLTAGLVGSSVASGVNVSRLQGDTVLNTNYRLQNQNTGSATNTSSTTAVDTSFHVHKIEEKSSSIDYSVDGSVAVTSTENLPIVQQQPYIGVFTRDTTESEINITYCEAYNT